MESLQSFLLAPRGQWLVAWRIAQREVRQLTKIIVVLYGLVHLSRYVRAATRYNCFKVTPTCALQNSVCGDCFKGSEVRFFESQQAKLVLVLLWILPVCQEQSCHVAVDVWLGVSVANAEQIETTPANVSNAVGTHAQDMQGRTQGLMPHHLALETHAQLALEWDVRMPWKHSWSPVYISDFIASLEWNRIGLFSGSSIRDRVRKVLLQPSHLSCRTVGWKTLIAAYRDHLWIPRGDRTAFCLAQESDWQLMLSMGLDQPLCALVPLFWSSHKLSHDVLIADSCTFADRREPRCYKSLRLPLSTSHHECMWPISPWPDMASVRWLMANSSMFGTHCLLVDCWTCWSQGPELHHFERKNSLRSSSSRVIRTHSQGNFWGRKNLSQK